jgi:hypothetical protein
VLPSLNNNGGAQMKIKSARIGLAMAQIVSAVVLAACASATAVPVSYDSSVSGFRIYDVKPILVVNGQNSSIELIPNYNKAYAVQFSAFLAKQDFTLDVERGMLKKLDSKQDSTAAIVLLQDLLKQVAPALTGKAMSGTVEGGTENRFQVFEFVFADDGNLVELRPLIAPRDLLNVRTTRLAGGTTVTRVVPQAGSSGTIPALGDK